MKLLFVLCVVIILYAKHLYGKEHETKCDGILVRDKFHKKEILGKGLNRPYQLAYDQNDHKIFFSYNTGSDDEDSFGIGYIEKNHTEHKALEDVENGFAIAMDNKDNVVYFGGSGGLYKQHLKGNNTKIKNIISYHNIWDMFFKHHLYFINFPSQHLYKYEDGKAKRQKHIHEKIFQFVIDGNDDIFITNETGLFCVKNGTSHRIFYEGPKIFRSVEINNKGRAYFAGQNGIYVANKNNDTLEKIAHVKNIFGMTFDHKDNIIYSDPHEIIRLLPEKCPEEIKPK